RIATRGNCQLALQRLFYLFENGQVISCTESRDVQKEQRTAGRNECVTFSLLRHWTGRCVQIHESLAPAPFARPGSRSFFSAAPPSFFVHPFLRFVSSQIRGKVLNVGIDG